MSLLTGKIALVTGGSRGIGSAIVRDLAAKGARVYFTYAKSQEQARSIEQEIKFNGGEAKALQADAAKLEELSALIQNIAQGGQKIDILVNNAGVFETGPLGDVSPENYHHTMKVNVESVFHLTQVVLPHLCDGSRIINISSVVGERAPFGGISVYAASKFALIGFTRAWARDLGSRGILVNAVLPGPIDTDMNPDNEGDFARMLKSGIPLSRYGKAEEVAKAVSFLAGPDSSYITGATLTVDGGMNA